MNINNKYKGRTPEETIEIIEQFFKDKNCTIKKMWELKSEIGTYANGYDIIYHNIPILSCYGKGTTETYAKASCYGELYERFCAVPLLMFNEINYYNYKKFNYQKNHYYVDKNEKELTIKEILDNDLMAKATSCIIPNHNSMLTNAFLHTALGEKIYGTQYINLNELSNDKYFYCNSLLANIYCGTTGFAAGNTLEEAIIQAISEIYEREVHVNYLKTNKNKYYYLDISCLSQYIQNLIKKLEELNYEVRIYDLSYNFNLPVCMAVIINKENHLFYTHFGSFPIIDIAVERCLTEFYQGVKDIPRDKRRKLLITPDCAESDDFIDAMSNGDYNREIVVKNLFINSKKINCYNDIIFKDSLVDYTNTELIKHINKINEINKIDFYYKDISLINNMSAVHIVSKNGLGSCEDAYINEEIKISKIKKYYYESAFLGIDIIKKIKNLCISNVPTDTNQISNFLMHINSIMPKETNEQYDFLDGLTIFMGRNYCEPITCKQACDPDNNLIFANYILYNFNNVKINNNTRFADNLIPWLYYYNFCIKGDGNLNEYNRIMAALGYGILDIDKNTFTPYQYINESLIKNLQDVYNNNEYFDFINLFVK